MKKVGIMIIQGKLFQHFVTREPFLSLNKIQGLTCAKWGKH